MIDFKIPDPIMPTEEETIAIAENWFKAHKGIHMLDWNEALIAESFPFEAVILPKHLVKIMLNGGDGKLEFNSLVFPALKKIGSETPFFLKLITRSPKDYLDENFEIKTVEDAYDALCGSLRTWEDLCMLMYIDMAYVIVRPFIKIKKEDEFRALIHNKEIVGISQYYYTDDLKISEPESKEQLIRDYCNNKITPNVSVDSFVADVVFIDGELKLIELNPFGLSDPCLFGNYSSLDGTFKYNK